MMLRRLHFLTSRALGCSLALIAASKFVLTYPSDAVMPQSLSLAIGALELATAFLLLLGRHIPIASTFVGVVSGFGVVLFFAFPTRPCGCAGHISGWPHFLLSCAFGAVASICLLLDRMTTEAKPRAETSPSNL
jgi:hypothetical protein